MSSVFSVVSFLLLLPKHSRDKNSAQAILYSNAGHVNQAKNGITVCASCRQPLAGRYCSHCGEEALDPRALTVRHFITHTVVEVLDLDSKIWRTLRNLIFRPGFLTAEYCAGRRQLYIKPVRLLIIAIIAYALLTRAAGGMQVSLFIGGLVLSIAPTAVPEGASVTETVQRIDRFGILENVLAAKEKSADLTSDAARERFHRRLERFVEPLSFANVLLLGFVLYAFFRRERPLFAQHGVFSMHLVSFVMFSSLMFLPLPWLVRVNQSAVVLTIILVGVIWQFAYLAVAIRRFYFGKDLRRFRPGLLATSAALLIYVLNSAFVTGVQLLGGALALWRF